MINEKLDARRVLNRRIEGTRSEIQAQIQKELTNFGEGLEHPEIVARRILNLVVEEIGNALNKN